ncbi:hypothetical protein Pmani_021032 [Petrolisthes manimaculis]|uniref:Uncharacterized protein n=1 Tax=Petrolisthes manimaculis TaxID=1843537 RepID=A0AAE1PGE7_9EUCA|nr:hypothetical protein Pmani_021032 [Petrolisthes manimaculis]
MYDWRTRPNATPPSYLFPPLLQSVGQPTPNLSVSSPFLSFPSGRSLPNNLHLHGQSVVTSLESGTTTT